MSFSLYATIFQYVAKVHIFLEKRAVLPDFIILERILSLFTPIDYPIAWNMIQAF